MRRALTKSVFDQYLSKINCTFIKLKIKAQTSEVLETSEVLNPAKNIQLILRRYLYYTLSGQRALVSAFS